MSETGRVEAFSNGVFAIAVTLLVLEIHVPSERGHALTEALTRQWPSYAAYVVSFLVIGVMWVNHHALFGLLVLVKFGDTQRHRALAHPGGTGDQPDPAMADRPGLRAHQQTPLPLIQRWQDRFELGCRRGLLSFQSARSRPMNHGT